MNPLVIWCKLFKHKLRRHTYPDGAFRLYCARCDYVSSIKFPPPQHFNCRCSTKEITMNNIKEKLEFIANAAEVERFHMMRTSQRQNVADHSFGVAWGCWLMTDGKPSANLLMAALAHDAAEHEVGDIPAPTKRTLGLRELLHTHEAKVVERVLGSVHGALTEDELRVLSLADSLDGLMFCYRELRTGNTRMEWPFNNYRRYAQAQYHTATSAEVELLMTAIEMCEEHIHERE